MHRDGLFLAVLREKTTQEMLAVLRRILDAYDMSSLEKINTAKNIIDAILEKDEET